MLLLKGPAELPLYARFWNGAFFWMLWNLCTLCTVNIGSPSINLSFNTYFSYTCETKSSLSTARPRIVEALNSSVGWIVLRHYLPPQIRHQLRTFSACWSLPDCFPLRCRLLPFTSLIWVSTSVLPVMVPLPSIPLNVVPESLHYYSCYFDRMPPWTLTGSRWSTQDTWNVAAAIYLNFRWTAN